MFYLCVCERAEAVSEREMERRMEISKEAVG